jgi:hypothetical protein
MIDTFLFLRLLNPKIVKIFRKIFVFRQEFEVWYLPNFSNLTSVVAFWSHEFIEKHWPFSVQGLIYKKIVPKNNYSFTK